MSHILNRKLIRRLRNNFLCNWTGIHGGKHWARVRRNGLFLAQQTGADTKVVELFSFIHDSCRANEGRDEFHGMRAALSLPKLMGDGLIDISIEQLEMLDHACHYHCFGATSDDPTIGTCWDADRLDLSRPGVGIIPEVKFFSTDAGRQVLEKAMGGGL